MDEPVPEYRGDIGVGEPLRQGDILEAVDSNASKWCKHLFIITADCDFEHQKHQGRVTCIPLLSSEDYHLEMQVPRLRDSLAKKPLAQLLKILERVEGPRITEKRLREWSLEQEPDTIATALNLSGPDAEVALQALAALRMIDMPAESLESAVKGLVDAQMTGNQPPKRENAAKKVIGQLKGAYSQPPGDALFISSFAPGHGNGYFAYLRHMEQVRDDQIAIGPGHRGTSYRRISRLQDRYTHALVQRFAMVFMSIGLPSAYEQVRDFHSDLMEENFQ